MSNVIRVGQKSPRRVGVSDGVAKAVVENDVSAVVVSDDVVGNVGDEVAVVQEDVVEQKPLQKRRKSGRK